MADDTKRFNQVLWETEQELSALRKLRDLSSTLEAALVSLQVHEYKRPHVYTAIEDLQELLAQECEGSPLNRRRQVQEAVDQVVEEANGESSFDPPCDPPF